MIHEWGSVQGSCGRAGSPLAHPNRAACSRMPSTAMPCLAPFLPLFFAEALVNQRGEPLTECQLLCLATQDAGLSAAQLRLVLPPYAIANGLTGEELNTKVTLCCPPLFSVHAISVEERGRAPCSGMWEAPPCAHPHTLCALAHPLPRPHMRSGTPHPHMHTFSRPTPAGAVGAGGPRAAQRLCSS